MFVHTDILQTEESKTCYAKIPNTNLNAVQADSPASLFLLVLLSPMTSGYGKRKKYRNARRGCCSFLSCFSVYIVSVYIILLLPNPTPYNTLVFPTDGAR